jgi:hypothetical protein
MSYTKNLKVERTFQVLGRGFFIVPALSLYEMNFFTIFNDNIEILLPDGSRNIYPAHFDLEHFIRTDKHETRIVIILPNATKKDVPDGSEVFVSDETASRLELD